MDPNVTLERMRELVKTIMRDYEGEDSNGVDQDDAAALASNVEAMDTWMSQHGLVPVAWSLEHREEQSLYDTVYRVLSENQSRCCDNEDDRKVLALALATALNRP